MIHLNGHQICVIDCETTGLDPSVNEVIEVAFLPLDFNLNPRKDVPFFDVKIKPENLDDIEPGALKVNQVDFMKLLSEGMDKYEAADLFVDWFDKLRLAENKRILPLAHNWNFDCNFIKAWLGPKTFEFHIDGRYRDSMAVAQYINDRADHKLQSIPFPKVNLSYIASQLKIPHDRAHTALGDCVVTGEVYKELLTFV